MTHRVAKYQIIFVEANGPGPWPCGYCGEDVVALTFEHGLVHHIDKDRSNDAPKNLVAMHRPCHARHHLKGKPRSPEVVARMVANKPSMKGYKYSDEGKRNMGHPRGGSVSQETRQKISAALAGRKHSPERVRNMAAGRARARREKEQDV